MTKKCHYRLLMLGAARIIKLPLIDVSTFNCRFGLYIIVWSVICNKLSA